MCKVGCMRRHAHAVQQCSKLHEGFLLVQQQTIWRCLHRLFRGPMFQRTPLPQTMARHSPHHGTMSICSEKHDLPYDAIMSAISVPSSICWPPQIMKLAHMLHTRHKSAHAAFVVLCPTHPTGIAQRLGAHWPSSPHRCGLQSRQPTVPDLARGHCVWICMIPADSLHCCNLAQVRATMHAHNLCMRGCHSPLCLLRRTHRTLVHSWVCAPEQSIVCRPARVAQSWLQA